MILNQFDKDTMQPIIGDGFRILGIYLGGKILVFGVFYLCFRGFLEKRCLVPEFGCRLLNQGLGMVSLIQTVN